MNLQDYYLEEDLFPAIFADYEERPYGILFYDAENKDSYDSNHAVIYKDKIDNLQQVLSDIICFYNSKGRRAIIYQSMLDDGWFEEIRAELAAAGFKSWSEVQEYMIPCGENKLVPNPEIEVSMVKEWSDELENVFLEAEEPWEIKVAKKSLQNPDSRMFAARLDGKVIGLMYCHISDRACRGDYLLVSKKHRGIGAGRALFHKYVAWCQRNGIDNAYLWPEGDTPKRIY